MKQIGTSEHEDSLSEIAGKIAIGASAVAFMSGIIALGAYALSDQKTKDKISSESRTIFENLRLLIHQLRATSKSFKQ